MGLNANIEFTDGALEKFVKQQLNEKLDSINIESLIEARIGNKVSEIMKKSLSNEKIDNFARDRVSRIITTESIKDFTFGITEKDVLNNLESKILLMIKHSDEFKLLVKNVLKNSLG